MVYVAVLTESLAWDNFILETLPSSVFQLCSLNHHANSYAVSNEAVDENGAWEQEGLVQTSITPEKHFCEPMAIEDTFMSAEWFGGKLKIISYKSLKS